MEEKLIKSMKGMGAFIFFIGFLFVDIEYPFIDIRSLPSIRDKSCET